VERARRIIGLYEEAGIGRERILIKIGVYLGGHPRRRAAGARGDQLQPDAAVRLRPGPAPAPTPGVFLISPFVGRILDWYKANTDLVIKRGEDDPGVQSVQRIYRYYKQHDYGTVVMGASFRNSGEIEALAGCDRLTISPALLEELAGDNGDLPRQLAPGDCAGADPQATLEEPRFRLALNDDAMATEKLAEGIRNFIADQKRLEQVITEA
jgi:transaldolase